MKEEMILAPESMPSVQPPMPAAVTAGALLQAAVAANLGVEGVKALAEIWEREQTRQAEIAFNRAFARVQSELPKIVPTGRVADKNDSKKTRYWFAEFDNILDIVQPILTANGFALAFDTVRGPESITAKCTLMHADGHSRTNQFTVRVGSGPLGTNEAQADGSARSFAKRYALADALNLNIERGGDNDGASAVRRGTITADQAADLRALVQEVGRTEAGLCAIYGVGNLDSLPMSLYEPACKMLRRAQK